MPKVPEIPNKQLKTIYTPKHPEAPASMKQRNLIITLCERRKIPTPDLSSMNTAQAAQLISNMLNDGTYDRGQE